MFNPMCAHAASEAARLLKPAGRILDFGCQTFDAVGIIPEAGDAQTTEEFYLNLGFQRYLAIDVNEELGAKIYDLNQSLVNDQGFDETFELVVNAGTSEHVFDQRAVFENAHDVCVLGGLILHIVPMTPHLNHGFYNYNPTLFADIAVSNEYEWQFLWFGDRWANRTTVNSVSEFLTNATLEHYEQLVSQPLFKSDVIIVAAFKKVKENAFRVPIQGAYQESVGSHQLKQRYELP